MQFAKDSFFVALRQRLASLNPQRTVTLNGATTPAILVVENLPPYSAERLPNCFYVEFGAAQVLQARSGNSALMEMNCQISYYTLGTVESMVDRGRVLGQLDRELLSICQPTATEKQDFTQSPSADLGTTVFWTQPALDEGKAQGVEDNVGAHADGRVARQARMTAFFYSEVVLP
jgi:hypothetical protein